MIVIKKQGKKLKKYKIIYTITCPNCDCEFECESDDFKSIEKRIDGDKVIDCPWCNKEIHTKDLKDIKTREEEIIEPNPIIFPFNPNPDYDPWRYPSYPDPRGGRYPDPSIKDPCETCPNRFGPRDGLGNPTVGDSPCQWCPNYKWKVTYATCSDYSNCNYSTEIINKEIK